MSKCEDLTGRRFGRLLVLERAENKKHKVQWLCQCDCGNKLIVKANSLREKNTQSCGCYSDDVRKQVAKKNFTKHGFSHTKLYNVYMSMKQRCFNPNEKEYKNYGGRGIIICNEWLGEDGFLRFRDWALHNGFSDGLSIDRICVDGNYEPNNCRWIPLSEQMTNKRNTVRLTYNGKSLTIKEWSAITGINKSTLKDRHRSGWSDEDVLTRPLKTRKAKQNISNESEVN